MYLTLIIIKKKMLLYKKKLEISVCDSIPTFQYFGLERHMMQIIPETRRAN
jgi:hypothetical protein